VSDAPAGAVRVTTTLDAGTDDLAGLAARLVAKDDTLWGPDAQPEAGQRLGWLDLPESSQALLPQLRSLHERFRAAGLDHVVLAGMGGSSLAPEVITRTAGVELTVLDSTDPHQVGAALADRLDRTVLVVASKSGSTVETDSHLRAYQQAFIDAGIDPSDRIVIVTDPGSPLEGRARDAGYETVLADPNVGGRYSALSAFGVTPSLLAGADVERLLADARVLTGLLADDDNPGLRLGAALGRGAIAGRDKLAIADNGSGIVGFGDWAEQLIAESTGKQGKGILPVVVEGVDAPGFVDPPKDVHPLVLGAAPDGFEGTSVGGSLGAQMLLWEYATAVAGHLIGINPFDQPNVAESKENTKKILDAAGDDGPLPEGDPAFVEGDVAVYGDLAALGSPTDLVGVLAGLLGQVPEVGYLAVMAYLDRHTETAAAGVRSRLAARLGGRATTFGWAPRFLHSTGQFHKGGPQVGVFLQITGAVERDVPVPGQPFSFGRLEMAQALGDLGALAERDRPAVRLHLRRRAEGVAQLLTAAERLTTDGVSSEGGT
jgi:glucose-6-phosphate isomerase